MQRDHSTIDQFKVLRTLGRGLHSKVKLAELQGRLYAVKKYKSQTATLETMQHELEILRTLEHLNIVRLHDARPQALYTKRSGKQEHVHVIILEYAEGGQLFDYIALCGRFTEPVARTYFRMMIDALEHCHGRGICHRDIKAENILLDGEFRLKLTDFGFASYLARGILTQRLGTTGYMAPEIRTMKYDGKEVDLFAAGVLLFFMVAGTPPFEKAVPNDPYYKVLAAKSFPVFWGAHMRYKPAGFQFSESFKDLINKMLALRPGDRLDIAGIKNHTWYNGDVLTLNELNNEFTQRKLLIEAKKNQLAQGQGGDNRDIFLNVPNSQIEEFNQSLGVDWASIKKINHIAVANKKELILEESPLRFAAKLHFLLRGNTNRILEEGVKESYDVVIGSKVIEVKLTHTMFEEERECTLLVLLTLDADNKLVVSFSHDEEESMDRLTFIRLTEYLKEMLRA